VKNGPVLGVVSPWFGGTYFGGLLGGITPAVAARNGKIIAIQTLDAGTYSTDFANPPDFRHHVAWDHADGFIVFLNAADPDYLRAAQEGPRPIVVISDVPAGVRCPTVLPDNHSGVRAATEHLIGHGHRRIAFAGHAAQKDAAERYAAFVATLAEHGLAHDPALFYDTGDMQIAGGLRAGRAMLAAGLPSTAVITGNDGNAIGVMRALTEAGYDLPADQAVIGFDNLPGTAYLTPSLTTVVQPLAEIGEVAVDVLARSLSGEDVPPETIRVATSLLIRESCGCPGPLSLPPVAGAGHGSFAADVRAALGDDSPSGVEDAAGCITEALAGAIAGDREMSGLALRRRLQPIVERVESYENVVAVMRVIRAHGRRLQADAGAIGDDQVTRRLEDAVYRVFVQLAAAQANLQAAYGLSTMSALGTQYSVSMQLLRSQERDPRSLEWLRSTAVRGGCLGLWPDRAGRSRLDVITTFDRRTGTERVDLGRIPIEQFPPADVVAMADVSAGDMLYIAHLKVGPVDWGMLALVGPIEAGLAEGRETMNQWSALLSVALEHDAVLTTMREQEEDLRRAALYDDLTGLPNRTHFRDRLAAAMTRPHPSYAVLLLDLDGFKLVNDSLGHEAGDQLLQGMAGRLLASLRPDDTAARLGGDEFAVLVEDFDDPRVPTDLAERLQESLSAPYHVAETDVVVSASIGIALGAEGYTDTQAVMRDADAAMYFAKAGGKRAHAVFAPSMHASAVNRLQVQTDLRQALTHHELVLHYQPIVDLGTGLASGAEALIRWQHPVRGLLGPADFLPVAEDSHLILPISDWVVGEACRQALDWKPLVTSVNVPNRQFWHPRFVADVRRHLETYGLDPGCLALEITEGVIMHDPGQAAAILESLHDMGIQIYIDDFGTGYSSLQAIHDLTFDALKVDRSFVSRMASSPKSRELVRTIVTMGRNLNLDVIAEGIETPAELAAVREIGCTHGQGYLYSRPAPAEDLITYVGGAVLR
jgi:diguanylate cyclase (GGDEF)-like protein